MKRIGLLVWSTVLTVAAVALLRRARLPDTTEPATAVMDVVRMVAGILAAYLLLATLATVLADATQSRLLALVVGRITTSGVRAVIAGVVGVGALAGPTVVAAEPREPAPIEVPVLRKLSDDAPPGAAHEVVPPAATEVVVRPGDHLWSISETALTARLGRPPSDEEIVPFWRAVIELNRDRLPNPEDPDLIRPGDRYLLPG